MPIRFRCAYCNQLMGIARRKANTVVSCPNCKGQVVVPDPGTADGDDGPPPANGAGPQLFDRSDFDQVFAPGAQPGPRPAKSPGGFASGPNAGAPAPARGPGYDVDPVGKMPRGGPGGTYAPISPPPAGIVLSPAKATVLSVVVVLLLGLAFFLGLLVGRSP
jgi:hypothetical protein